MKHQIYFLYCFLLGLTLPGCSTIRGLNDIVPTAEFHKFKIKGFEPHVRMDPFKISATLNLGLCFRIKNPYNRELRLPAPDLEFKIRNKTVMALNRPEDLATLKIRPKKFLDVYYDYRIELDPETQFGSLLGKDNPYRFRCTMVFNLKEYIRDSTVSQIADIALPRLSGLANRDLSRFKLELVYDDTLRLPLPPVISPDMTQSPRVSFAGEMESFSIKPATDLLQPFVQTFRDGTVSIPFVGDVVVINHVIEVLNLLGLDVSNKWENLLEAWSQLRQQPIIQYPGPNTTGVQIQIPVIIHNPNEFEIECPQYNVGVFSNMENTSGYQPFFFDQKVASGPNMIGPLANKKVWIRSGINWDKGYTIPAILSGTTPSPIQPGIKGAFTYDLGYGAMNIPFQFDVREFNMW